MPFSFLHPLLFGIGAACVSIPIIIHLLKRRRRVVSWGAMRFLEEAYRKRRRIITLEQLILLSLRCLLVLLIAMGVGSIVFGSGSGVREPQTLVIVLDDSIASAREVEGSAVIEMSKRHAIEQLDALDPMLGDRVALISASSPAQAVVMPASDDLGAVRALIEQAVPTDAAIDLSGVLNLVSQVGGDPDRPAKLQLLLSSDSRAFGHAIAELQADPTRLQLDALLLPTPEPAPAINVGIVSATPTRSLVVRDGLSMPEAISVELMRTGSTEADGRTLITLVDADGTNRGTGTLSWRAGERSRTLSVALRTDGLEPEAATSTLIDVRLDADANPRDNESAVALPVRNSLRVAIIDRPQDTTLGAAGDVSPARWARAALAPRNDLGIQITSINASQAAARLVQGVDAIFVLAPTELNDAAWDRLARLRDQGVMLIVTPDAENDSLAWIDQLRRMEPDVFAPLQQIKEHDPNVRIDSSMQSTSLLSGVASEFELLVGAVDVSRSLSISSSAQAIATLSDGSPLGVQVTNPGGAGMLVLLSIPFDLRWSNLPARPLFVALMQELVRQGVGVGESLPPVIAGVVSEEPAWVESIRRVRAQEQEGQADTGATLYQHASALALRDAQGLTRAVQIIRANAAGAVADQVDQAVLTEQLRRFVESAELTWLGSSENQLDSAASDRGSDSNRYPYALWMLWAALAVGLFEFVLARLFTARLIASEQAMGAEGRGARA